jgi:hypothetical protein
VEHRAVQMNNSEKITLLRDKDWTEIDGRTCRVIEFIPMASIKDGLVLAIDKSTPYASVRLECKVFPGQEIIGYITHKLDFVNLWKAFKERGVNPDEEVIIFWSVEMYKFKIYKFLSSFMPKLWVMICPKEAYNLMTDREFKPELTGMARWKAEKPIIDWKPVVME